MSNKNKTTPSTSKLIVSGEDLESEDEIDLEPRNPVIAVTDADGRSSSGVKVVTFQGEAPESDYEGKYYKERRIIICMKCNF